MSSDDKFSRDHAECLCIRLHPQQGRITIVECRWKWDVQCPSISWANNHTGLCRNQAPDRLQGKLWTTRNITSAMNVKHPRQFAGDIGRPENAHTNVGATRRPRNKPLFAIQSFDLGTFAEIAQFVHHTHHPSSLQHANCEFQRPIIPAQFGIKLMLIDFHIITQLFSGQTVFAFIEAPAHDTVRQEIARNLKAK
jgi:hypothetical protein